MRVTVSMRVGTAVVAMSVAVVVALAAGQSGSASGGQAENEINNIPYEQIIAAPLNAIVQAQASAARTTMNFIFDAGFTRDTNTGKQNPRMIHFDYNSVSNSGNRVTGRFNVPVLSMVPIPFLRFEACDVEFSVRIVENHEVQSTASGSWSGQWTDENSLGWYARHGKEYRSSGIVCTAKTQAGQSETREYSTRIKVHASQADIPEGMGKMMDKLLELALSMAAAES